MTPDGRDLDYLLAGEVVMKGASDLSQTTDQWHEEGPYLLLLVLPLAALAFRRGWLLVVVAALLPLAEPAEAALWEELWLNDNQRAARRLDGGAPEEAATLFEDPEWRAVARYRAGDYANSAALFAERGDVRSLYNLGNAMAMQGEFESAIDAYEQVLELDPDHADAAYNRDLLESAQEERQRQQGEQQESAETSAGDSQSSDQPSDPNQQADTDAQADGESDDSDPSARPEDESAEQDLEALREELERAAEDAEQQQSSQQLSDAELAELRRLQAEQQAMEQWLRRIPNDPGGLLRRKFRYQYQRLGKDQDGNNLWPDNEAQPW